MVGQYPRRGFTLIELLVVVLIIGILAAVALPQYQKAVEKSRATEGVLFIKTLQRALDVYFLANPEAEISTKEELLSVLDIGLTVPQNFTLWLEGDITRDLCTKCLSLARSGTFDYELYLDKFDDHWRHECDYYNQLGGTICNSLVNAGWYPSDEG